MQHCWAVWHLQGSLPCLVCKLWRVICVLFVGGNWSHLNAADTWNRRHRLLLYGTNDSTVPIPNLLGLFFAGLFQPSLVIQVSSVQACYTKCSYIPSVSHRPAHCLQLYTRTVQCVEVLQGCQSCMHADQPCKSLLSCGGICHFATCQLFTILACCQDCSHICEFAQW